MYPQKVCRWCPACLQSKIDVGPIDHYATDDANQNRGKRHERPAWFWKRRFREWRKLVSPRFHFFIHVASDRIATFWCRILHFIVVVGHCCKASSISTQPCPQNRGIIPAPLAPGLGNIGSYRDLFPFFAVLSAACPLWSGLRWPRIRHADPQWRVDSTEALACQSTLKYSIYNAYCYTVVLMPNFLSTLRSTGVF